LVERGDVVARSDAKGRDVLGSRVITEEGKDLGKVVDVIIEVAEVADVVGYEIEPTESVNKDGRRLLIPLPDTLSVSGEALMVPDEALEFVADDLAGFGASVEAFRSRLSGGNSCCSARSGATR
jgi:sporulation protein YlmC with PRC-barrel domain